MAVVIVFPRCEIAVKKVCHARRPVTDNRVILQTQAQELRTNVTLTADLKTVLFIFPAILTGHFEEMLSRSHYRAVIGLYPRTRPVIGSIC